MLKAPFVFFGGKSMIASIVWKALGQPKHYIEPCFGSGIVLLQRPNYDPTKHVETVNDANGSICNVWRSIKFSPEETAEWCDWPVDHCNLISRKKVLIKNEERLLENLINDDMWHDPKMAGYWIWAASCSIGTGMLSINQIPHIGHGGRGVHSLGSRNVSTQIPSITRAGQKIHSLENRNNTKLYKWFKELSNRLRHVRVVCGDWSRVCGGDWQDMIGDVGIFMDPPYGVEDRVKVYVNDSINTAHDIRKWCLERGDKKSYRIVLTGYEEHKELLENGWTAQSWKANGGYGNVGGSRGKENAKREMIYFSPYCIKETGIFKLLKGEK